MRPLALEQGLGTAVPALLPPVRKQRAPAVVPDHCRRIEVDPLAGFLEAPAEIDVVAGRAKLRVESTEFVQHVFPDREVAAGNVLGLGVGDEDVDRPARRASDALGDRVRVRRRDVRSANRAVASPIEGVREVMRPVRIRPRVGVEIGDDLAGSGSGADVPGAAQPLIGSPDERRRPVVDDDDLEFWVLHAPDPLQGRPQRSPAVESADHHRHSRPVTFSGERHVRKGGGDRGQRRFRRAVGASQTECPIVDVRSGAEPLVGPREHQRARTA